jgi:putative tryptophan/tyrosine transport system substrate-binding protein
MSQGIGSVKRRDFIRLAVGAAIGLPRIAHAQQGAMPLIGFEHSGSPEQNVKRLAAFRKGLSEQGFVEGQNLVIEFRWAAGQNEKLAPMAVELVQRNPAAIFADTRAVVAVKAATTTIPIVFAIGTDPVALGLVNSLNHPGGNITGVTSENAELAAKRLGVLRDLVPSAAHYFTIINPTSALTEPFTKELRAAAATLGIKIELLRASNVQDIEAAFANIPRQPDTVLVFPPDSFFYIHRDRIAALAASRGLPTIFDVRDYVEAGGLVSYGSDFLDVMRLAGVYVGRVLKGDKPADLPVQVTSKYELAINLKTAKTLGLRVPPTLLATADAVIE